MTAALVFAATIALAFALIQMRAGDTTSVLAVRDQVAKGETIERADLISIQVSGVDGAVPVEAADTVIGKTARVDLVAGQVITTPQVTDNPVPGAGNVLIGLALKASQMPGDGLAAGDQVQVVAVPAPDAAAADELTDAKVLTDSAQVYSVRGGDAESGEAGTAVVTVIAPKGDTPQLSAYASTGRVAIVKLSAGDK